MSYNTMPRWIPTAKEAWDCGFDTWTTVNPDGSRDKRDVVVRIGSDNKTVFDWGPAVRIKEPRE